MPKKIKQWFCTICWHLHPTKKAAMECESLGEPEVQFEIGQSFFQRRLQERPGGGTEKVTDQSRLWTITGKKIKYHTSGHIVIYQFELNNGSTQKRGISWINEWLEPVTRSIE